VICKVVSVPPLGILMDSTVGEILTVTVMPLQIVTSSAAVGKAAPVPAMQLVADHVIALQFPVLRANRGAASALDVAKHAAISNANAPMYLRHVRISIPHRTCM
jgi:hypothetical protein